MITWFIQKEIFQVSNPYTKIMQHPKEQFMSNYKWCDIREFKIRSLRTTDYGNTQRGPGSRFTAHAR